MLKLELTFPVELQLFFIFVFMGIFVFITASGHVECHPTSEGIEIQTIDLFIFVNKCETKLNTDGVCTMSNDNDENISVEHTESTSH